MPKFTKYFNCQLKVPWLDLRRQITNVTKSLFFGKLELDVKCPKQPLNDVLRLFRKYLGKHLWWNPILDYIFANLKKTDEIIANLRYTQNTSIGIFHNLRVLIKAKDDFFAIFGNSLKI